MCMVAPTSMAAAFWWTIGIVRSILGFDLLRFISNPPADDGGRAGLRYLVRFLNGIAGWRHHSQVRNNPWTMFFNGVTTTKIVTAAPFRAQPSVQPFLSPQAARSPEIVF
jgi:hypothetical protein